MDKKKFLVGLVLVTSVLFASFFFYGWQLVYTPNLQVGKEVTYILIKPGMKYNDVKKMVRERRIVHDMLSFNFMSKLMGYQDAVKPGFYKIEEDMTNLEAIRMLRGGVQTPTHITFNNVRLKSDLAGKMSQNIALDSVKILSMLQDDSIAQAYGFTDEDFMTMFIPNTYEVYYTISGKELMDRMHREYEKFWTDERKAKAKEIGLKPVQVSILASIVQAETTMADEAPKVAGVYINRLHRNMLLQADPAIVFAWKDFTIKRVLNKHKEIDSPYNLYKHRGLPPGPICLPSIHSIESVLNYEKHDYLYFCARPDFSGYHDFAKTLREHNRNAAQYQHALNKAKIFE